MTAPARTAAPSTRPRLDPIDHAARCVHDMLIGQCSWCKGLPDVPIDYGFFGEGVHVDTAPEPPPGTFLIVTLTWCDGCDRQLPIGSRAQYVPGFGVAGTCCARAEVDQ